MSVFKSSSRFSSSDIYFFFVYDAVSLGKYFLTFRENSGLETPETSYPVTRFLTSEEQIPQPHCCESLKRFSAKAVFKLELLITY